MGTVKLAEFIMLLKSARHGVGKKTCPPYCGAEAIFDWNDLNDLGVWLGQQRAG